MTMDPGFASRPSDDVPASATNPKKAARRIVNSVVSALDSGSRTRLIPLPGDAARGMKCHVVDGEIGGKRHRVIVEEAGAGIQGSAGRIRSLAEARKALKADAAFLCGARGFSAERLLFALKQGVQVLESDSRGRVRVHTGRASIVRHVGVEDWALSLTGGVAGAGGFSFDSRSDIPRLLLRDKPLANWLCRTSRKLLRTVKEDCLLKAEYTLKRPVGMSYQGRTLEISRLEVWYACRIRFRLHSACVELDHFAYQPRGARLSRALAKSMQAAFPMEWDREVKAPLFPADGGPDLKPDYHVYHPFRGVDGKGMPGMDSRVGSVRIVVESGLGAAWE